MSNEKTVVTDHKDKEAPSKSVEIEKPVDETPVVSSSDKTKNAKAEVEGKTPPAKKKGKAPDSVNENELTKTEQKLLEEHTKVIKAHMANFFEVGKAVWDINEKKLYRASGDNFGEFVEREFGMARATAYHYMNCIEVQRDLSTIVDIEQPVRDCQVRPLTKLEDAEQRRTAWRNAVEKANGGKVTGNMVEAAVLALSGNQRVVSNKPKTPSKTGKQLAKAKELGALIDKGLNSRKFDTMKAVLEEMLVTYGELVALIDPSSGDDDEPEGESKTEEKGEEDNTKE